MPASRLINRKPRRLTKYEPLVARLVSAIQAEILEGALKPAERLEELTLSRRFKVSRTPIREALRQLAATRLVELRPRLGAVVASPTAGEVLDLFELMAELEGVAARLASERADDVALAGIETVHERCQTAARGRNAAAYYRINRDFHDAIHAASGNRALMQEIAALDRRLSPYRRFITFRAGRTETALREHEQIVRALAKRDSGLAEAAMRDHVRILGDDAAVLVKGLQLA